MRDRNWAIYQNLKKKMIKEKAKSKRKKEETGGSEREKREERERKGKQIFASF